LAALRWVGSPLDQQVEHFITSTPVSCEVCDRLVLDVATGQPNLFIIQRPEMGSLSADVDKWPGAGTHISKDAYFESLPGNCTA